MELNYVVPVVIVFVVVAFTLSIGTIVLEEAADQMCSGTYVDSDYCDVGVTTCNNTVVNPVTSGYFGCCSTGLNATQDCPTWSTDASINASTYGNDSLIEMSEWLPTLALVVIAAVIIGILITYLARGGTV